MARLPQGQPTHPPPVRPQVAACNPGTPLDLPWVRSLRVDRRDVERGVASVAGGRGERAGEAALLLRAIRCLDLTALSDDVTPARIRQLCGTAQQPVAGDLLAALGADAPAVRVAAVCVHGAMVATAVDALAGSDIPVAAVAGGFPHGFAAMAERVKDVAAAVADGAREVDVVISRRLARTGDWSGLYGEVRQLRGACGPARLKTILATGDLGTHETVARAGAVCLMAGADFLKTSTGKERVNATLPVGFVLAGIIRTYECRSGWRVGLKPAGGIRTADQAMDWLRLAQDALGEAWLEASLFRLGASELLADVEARLAHLAAEGPAPRDRVP